MPVRLFIGNLPYGASEADLRAHFAAIAEPSHVVMPVDRETGRPRGFAFVEFADRGVADQVIQRFNAQPFQGRNLAVSEARAREDRPPGPRPAGGFGGPRPAGGFGG
ncbi:MAG: RNA recognition motif domain-containing protein, partial [Vicinamibacterales bacterium]